MVQHAVGGRTHRAYAARPRSAGGGRVRNLRGTSGSRLAQESVPPEAAGPGTGPGTGPDSTASSTLSQPTLMPLAADSFGGVCAEHRRRSQL